MDEDARKAKLELLLTRLENGKHVQNRDLRTCLSKEGYAAYEAQWAKQREYRAEIADKPKEIEKYEALLKRAIFAYNKADAASSSKKHKTAKKLFRHSDIAFGRLYEFLSEIEDDGHLHGWFNCDIRFTAATAPAYSPEEAPRIVNQLEHVLQTKRETKIAAIEYELERISNPVPDKTQQRAMQERLAKLRRRKS